MTNLVPIPSPGETLFYGEPGNPAVIVLHDMYGRLPWLEPFATAVASRGFRVAVPDLYDGVCTVDGSTARELMQKMDVARSLAIIDDSVEQAQETGVERVGLVGFSMGGWLALLHAQAGGADAVVAYYASLGSADHGVIPCSVLLQWAEIDSWRADEDPQSFVERLRDDGTTVIEHTYLGTQHSFANASLPDTLDTRAAALAFARTAVFLEAQLID
ncbi:MAG: dienelactone hydrolase family protein [Salinibacterium sp.]|nr:dienelactone hydrolase family protein [Salinibacterium sp.]